MDEKDFLLPIGATLQGGKYRVEAHLASGGFGNTYRITNVTFNEVFALKEFYLRGVNERDEATQKVSVSNAVNSEEFKLQKDKFHKEALRLRKLDNPHVVRVHDLFEENGTAYYVMDFLDGESLSAQMRKQGHPFTEQEVMDFTDQVLDALDAIHQENIWHLDLKPGNIMTDRNGRAVLIDFGASKQFHDANGHSLSTSTGLCYTPGFAPTEQIESSTTKMGPWTDLYALGATMYNLLTMKTPPSVSEIQDGDAFEFPSGSSNRMQQLIQWMMEPNRNKRPQSVADVRSFLQGHVSDSTRMASAPTAPSQATQMASTPLQATQMASAHQEPTRMASPSPRMPLTPQKKSKTPWIILGAVIGVFLLLVGIALVGFIVNDMSSGYESTRNESYSPDLSQVEAPAPTVTGPSARPATAEPASPVAEQPVASEPVYSQLSMYGTLGGANDAVLFFNEEYGGTVTFTVNGVKNTRNVSFNSYDESSGTLILNEYFTNGNYIGYFKGQLKDGTYKGVFTNETSGGKIDFNFTWR